MGEKIGTIAKIVFAIIFIALLATIMGVIMRSGNNAVPKMSDTLALTDSLDLNTYDGTNIVGESVRTAIQNGKAIGGSAKLAFVVKTLEDSDGTSYGYGTKSGENGNVTGKAKSGSTEISVNWQSSTKYTAKLESDPSSSTYINPNAYFNSTLLYNDNDVVVGILFEQQDK